MNAYAPCIKYFLLETTPLHEGVTTSLQPAINCLANGFSISQRYHISTNNLPRLLSTKLLGIALQWVPEDKPSSKDFYLLADVLERLSLE